MTRFDDEVPIYLEAVLEENEARERLTLELHEL